MSPALLAREVDEALSSGTDPRSVLLHVKEFLKTLPIQSPFGGFVNPPEIPSFERWWKTLPSEMKVGKRDAEKAWLQMAAWLPPVGELILTTRTQAEIRRRTGQSFLHPATFLRGKRWEDSLEALASWGGRKVAVNPMSDFDRQALDNDPRFIVGSAP